MSRQAGRWTPGGPGRLFHFAPRLDTPTAFLASPLAWLSGRSQLTVHCRWLSVAPGGGRDWRDHC